ncbi:MAG TPA: HAD-IA family hydrolase [Candidatus Nitrosotenuis sp.]|nr:HAD-IA family hydrolase [Candidatus Nitrosotenuis sp.]
MKFHPRILVFDVDGVLVDVRGSFLKSILDTVHSFTGRRFRRADIMKWKSRSGFNDDWKLSTAWINSLGVHVEYAEVKARFQEFYWGTNGRRPNVALERWLVSPRVLRALAKRAELNVFTGRTRQELKHTFERFDAYRFFRRIITMDDVPRLKPHPDGLLKILQGRDAATALYLGDNVDDALAARAAGVPFYGVLPRGSLARRALAPAIRAVGAQGILHAAADVQNLIA